MKKEIENWLNLMETTDLPKGEGSFFDEDTGCYCALGLLCLANNVAVVDENGTGNWTYVQSLVRDYEVYRLNDENPYMPFKEMAQEIRNNSEGYVK